MRLPQGTISFLLHPALRLTGIAIKKDRNMTVLTFLIAFLYHSKDSANKKLNAMLDKEPRWLHPRSRSDMNRRMQEMGNSPTRQNCRPPDLDQGVVKNEAGNSPDVHDFQTVGSDQMPGFQWTNNAALHQPDGHHHVAFAGVNGGNFPPTDDASSHPRNAYNAPPPNISTDSPARMRFSPSVNRRTTAMTSTTDMTITSLQRALSGYSEGFVRQVKKVIKRYTLPVGIIQDTSPISDSRPGTADSTQGSWVQDDSAPTALAHFPPGPGDFLIVDLLLGRQGLCVEGTPEHTARVCLCHATAELANSTTSWVSSSGPSPDAHFIIQTGITDLSQLHLRDDFGNTLLHLLAARDAPHEFLLHIIPNINTSANGSTYQLPKNTAGQTFLHVLGESWFTDLNGELSLPALLHALEFHKINIYGRDINGRNVFHIIQDKVPDDTVLSILEQFNYNSYSYRDNIGMTPAGGPGQNMQSFRRTQTGVFPQPQPIRQDTSTAGQPLSQTHSDEKILKQSRLLKFVESAQKNPKLEDYHGRNGLHCLAAAILSPDTLLVKYGAPQPSNSQADNNRKRKREQQSTSPKMLDSSKDRLTLREDLVRTLLDVGVDVNHYDSNGNTVLMAFVAQLPEDDDYKVPVSILELLINRGADINARNHAGETALHIAVRRGRKLAMRTLAQRGANVHARDGAGRSLLDVADAKMTSNRDGDLEQYAHFEACRAWLSGQGGGAVQSPTIRQEWGAPESEVVVN
jgi:hypothetical protein